MSKLHKKPPRVTVKWIDAIDRIMECKIDEVGAKVHLRERGHDGLLVYQDDYKTILAAGYDEAEVDDDDKRPDVNLFTVIPTGWIKSVTYISRKPRKPTIKPDEA